MADNLDTSWLPRLRGSAAEQKARAARDAAERLAAGQAPGSIILGARDVQGEYDAHRTLVTTLGGQTRPISRDDLYTFQHNIRQVQSRYRGGIRARQVLDLSLAADRERANREIRTAVPVAAYSGKVRFITNAGPDSDLKHHHVIVEFMSYASAASGARGDGLKSAAWLRREPLKIECDCGRWRYWFRYIATIGKFNAGRDETGYPKIRNPNLSGVACKHIVRVMAEVESSAAVQRFLARLIDKARLRDDNRVSVQATQEQARQQAGQGGVADVQATLRRRQAARERAARQRAKLIRAAASKTANTHPAPQPKKPAAATRRAMQSAARTLGAQFRISPEQVMALLAQARPKGKR
jgi:hypothetical protein